MVTFNYYKPNPVRRKDSLLLISHIEGKLGHRLISYAEYGCPFHGLMPTLSDHFGAPMAICRHPNEDPETGFWTTVFSVIIEANVTGFAMEFIGDMNDSQSTNWGAFSHFSSDYQMGSGVNLH